MVAKIKDIITYNKSLAIPFDFSIVKGNKRLVENNEVMAFFRSVRSWLFDTDETDINYIWQDFTDIWSMWVDRYKNSIEKLLDGWNADYNALENYDRKEDGTITDEHHKGTKTSTNVDLENQNKFKSTDKVNAFNDGLVTSAETSGDSSDNTSTTKGNANANYTTVEDIDGSHFDKDIRTFTNYRVHGNIGVTTSAQMLTAEKEMRKNDIIFEFLKTFIKEVCYYVG